MFKRIRENLGRGMDKLRWFATVLSERLKIEIAVIRLLYQSDEMEKSREDLFKTIGQRVYDLRDSHDKNIFRDKTVLEALQELEKIGKNIEDLKQKASEMSSVRV